RAQLAVPLRDERAPHGGPSVALVAQEPDDVVDLPHRHAIHGLLGRPPRHRAGVLVDPPVCAEEQVRVVELSIDVLQVQTLLASLTDDGEYRFGVPHLAYLHALSPSDHLAPFAMWPAFPASDYYGASVALGLAPCRRS